MKRILARIIQVLVACIPAVLGLMALMNNLSGFQGTVKYVIQPLISMSATYGLHTQTWRALPAEWADIAYIAMTVGETLVGVLAIVGIIQMLRHFRSAVSFERSKEWIYFA